MTFSDVEFYCIWSDNVFILCCTRACVHSKSLQSCLTLCDCMDYSLPGSSVYWILQARILEGVAMSFSRISSRPRDQTQVSYVFCIAQWALHHWHHLGSPHVLWFPKECLSLVFLIIAILAGVKCYLTVILIHISPVINMLNIFSSICWPSVYSFWTNVCPHLLPISEPFFACFFPTKLYESFVCFGDLPIFRYMI